MGLKMKAQAVEDDKKAQKKLVAKAKHIRKMNKEFQDANIKLKALKAREADAIAVEEAKIKVRLCDSCALAWSVLYKL